MRSQTALLGVNMSAWARPSCSSVPTRPKVLAQLIEDVRAGEPAALEGGLEVGEEDEAHQVVEGDARRPVGGELFRGAASAEEADDVAEVEDDDADAHALSWRGEVLLVVYRRERGRQDGGRLAATRCERR